MSQNQNNFIPVNEPLLTGREEELLLEAIRTGWISSEGPFIAQLEINLSAKLQREYGIAVCNGTAALEVALYAIGVGPGDEVIIPSFTIISCALAVIRRGAVPVFVDVDPISWNIDTNNLEEAVTEKTKAIMAVHIYGLPADMDAILRFAQSHNLKIIEDASQALGGEYKNRPCGSFGDVSTLSFYPNKLITTGEGGMVLTNDPTTAERAKLFRNLCFGMEHRFNHTDLGYNFRMSNLQAAVGCAQLERYDEHAHRKVEIGELYFEGLADLKDISIQPRELPFGKNFWWVFGIVLSDSCGWTASALQKHLATKGVGTRPFFWPLHLQQCIPQQRTIGECPVSAKLGNRGFYVPGGLTLTNEQIASVISTVREALEQADDFR